MKKKVLFLIISSILLLSLFVSCGDNSSNNEDLNNNVESNDDVDNHAHNESENESDADVNTENENEVNNDSEVDNESTDKDESDNNSSVDNNKDFTTIEKESTDIIDNIFTTIYNKDYSNEDKESILTSIKNSFTTSGYENISNKINNYNGEILVSDFIITLFKETDNINSSEYKATYNIRYNVTITSGKPAILADIIATVVVDNNNNILIESINNNEF